MLLADFSPSLAKVAGLVGGGRQFPDEEMPVRVVWGSSSRVNRDSPLQLSPNPRGHVLVVHDVACGVGFA